MAEIINFPNTPEAKVRELEKILTEKMYHPNSKVLESWKEMAKLSLRKHSGSPNPSKSSLSLNFPPCVSELEANEVASTVKEFIESYAKDVEKEFLEMFKEIIILQKTVAECNENKT